LVWSWFKNALINSFKSGGKEPKRHPHTWIAACVVSPVHVRAAAMGSDGVPCVYGIGFVTGSASWECSACTLHPNQREREEASKERTKRFRCIEGMVHQPVWRYCFSSEWSEYGAVLRWCMSG
jgi:hypothetical protein